MLATMYGCSVTNHQKFDDVYWIIDQPHLQSYLQELEVHSSITTPSRKERDLRLLRLEGAESDHLSCEHLLSGDVFVHSLNILPHAEVKHTSALVIGQTHIKQTPIYFTRQFLLSSAYILKQIMDQDGQDLFLSVHR